MNDGCRNRKYAHAKALLKKFERNTRMIEKTVRQRFYPFILRFCQLTKSPDIWKKKKI